MNLRRSVFFRHREPFSLFSVFFFPVRKGLADKGHPELLFFFLFFSNLMVSQSKCITLQCLCRALFEVLLYLCSHIHKENKEGIHEALRMRTLIYSSHKHEVNPPHRLQTGQHQSQVYHVSPSTPSEDRRIFYCLFPI